MRLPFIQAGQIVTTHGVRGEVKVTPWTDGPEFLKQFHRVRIAGREYKIESCRIQKTGNLLKLEGVETVEAGQALRNQMIEVWREDCSPDVIFGAELIGMQVFCDGKELGIVSEVLDYPGNMVYVVKGEHEYMIPAVKQFVLSTDLEQNRMQVKIIEGMRSDED